MLLKWFADGDDSEGDVAAFGRRETPRISALKLLLLKRDNGALVVGLIASKWRKIIELWSFIIASVTSVLIVVSKSNGGGGGAFGPL